MVGILAALEHRRRTGVGQHVDLSQLEAAVHYLGPLVMDSLNSGRIAGAEGNRDPLAAPHGVYPCIQEPEVERWIAIAVSNDAQWDALCDVMGDPDWTSDPKFATFLARKANEDELDQRIAEWTQGFRAYELMSRLQDAGVPAGVVQACSDLHSDPQLRLRNAFPRLLHAEMGEHAYDGVPFKLSKTPAEMRAAPCLGQHNELVYKEFLGMSDDEYQALLGEGVFR
jgi:benzylsuccinate CoA-transferase BbsF subunit